VTPCAPTRPFRRRRTRSDAPCRIVFLSVSIRVHPWLKWTGIDLRTFQPADERAGRHLRHDALDSRARGGPAPHAASGRRARGALPHLLVSALRLCPAARLWQGGCGGFDAGLLRAFPWEKLSRRLERGTRAVPRLPAGVAQTFSGERMGQVAMPKTRRRRDTVVAGLADGGYEFSSRRHQ